MAFPESQVARFWKYTNVSAGCWTWGGAKSSSGYGHMKVSGQRRNILAHRFSFQLMVADLSPREMVLHTCDNPPCVNPAHLVAGSQSDNMRMAMSRGRCRRLFKKGRRGRSGESHPMAVLTFYEVAQIRKRRRGGERLAYIAKDFGVSAPTISRICSGHRWRNS